MTHSTNGTGASDPMIRLRDVHKVYQMGTQIVRALDGVTLDIMPNEYVAIMGPSGSGKSTLLHMVSGLEPPSGGSILLAGHELQSMTEKERTLLRRDLVGFVFQFYNLIPSLTARENVALVTEISRHPMKPADALALVGLADRMEHFPAELSGGEQQRVAIARAIAKRPEVLLCDEPTGALDSSTGIRVLEALSSVNEELGTTTAIITHNAAIHAIADRVVYLADGRISETRVNEERLEPASITW